VGWHGDNPAMLSRRQFSALLPFSCSCNAFGAGPGLALTTILDGESTLVRADSKFTLAEGVVLQADDIIDVSDRSGKLVRIEFSDGVKLDLGPSARLMLAPRLAGERGRARAYLLRGWAKMTVPAKTAPAALLTPIFDATSITANAVLALMPEGAQAFAETGEIALRFALPSMPTLTLKTNEWMNLPLVQGAGKPALSPRPGPGFVQQVPRPFLDPLPSRAALFAGKEREPKPVGAVSYADAQPWIDNPEAAMRKLALTRWRALARNSEFRAGLLAGMKAHPEWQPVLFPPPPASAPGTYK
jgi:hypothetical protein